MSELIDHEGALLAPITENINKTNSAQTLKPMPLVSLVFIDWLIYIYKSPPYFNLILHSPYQGPDSKPQGLCSSRVYNIYCLKDQEK